jgi:hypothetical protein
MCSPPVGVEVEFWHAAPDRWRVDRPDGPLCRSDGTTAVVWSDDGLEVGGALLVFHGPPSLLHPPADLRFGEPADGTVSPDELLGRRCWRWERPDASLWVDEQTGCALRIERAEGRLELTAFETDVELEAGLFAVPADVLAGERVKEPPPPRPGQLPVPPRRVEAPSARFRVVWWPHGVAAEAVAGDAAVPEVLLRLMTDGAPTSPAVWLGIAPRGREPRVQSRAAVRRWDGEGWSFALSWRGEMSDEDVDRVVASTPPAWSLSGTDA